MRNRAYKEENLKEIISNYKQEEILRHEISLTRPESKRRTSGDSADLMSKRSWYGLRRVHLFGRGISRPRWLSQHLLSRLKSIRGDPAGYTRFALTDHGCVVASGQCDTDAIPNGRSLGSWNWYKRTDRGNVSRYPRDVSSAIRFRTSPPMCFFGNPIDQEQLRMDVNALNFDPSTRRRVHTEDENEDSSDDEDTTVTTMTRLDDQWRKELWFIIRMMMRTALQRLILIMNKSSSIETQLKRRVKNLRSSLRSRHHDLILTLRRQEMNLLKLNKKTIEDMRLEVEALETLFEESKRVVDDEHTQVEGPLLANDVFCGPTITFVSTNDDALYVFGRPTDVFTAAEIRDGLKLTSMIDFDDDGDVWLGTMTENGEKEEEDEEENRFRGLQVTVDEDDEFVALTVPHRVNFFSNKNLIVEKVACGGCVEGGQDAFVMFLTRNQTVFSYGCHYEGALGLGDEIEEVSTPTKIASLAPILDIACGESHVAAISSDGKVYVWGDNEFGQLGQGTIGGYESKPCVLSQMKCQNCDSVVQRSRMRSDVQFKSITIGQCHNALLTSSHQLWCWGGEIGSLCKRLYVDRCAHCKSGGGKHEVLRVSVAGRMEKGVVMCVVRCVETMRCSVLRGEFKNEMVSFQDVPYFNTQNAVDLFACGGTEEDSEFDAINCFVLCRPPLSV